MPGDPGGWYSVAPDCVESGVPPADGVAKAFEECSGFFTFGPGRVWSEGELAQGATTGLWIITAIGFLVSILAFVAWVWFEHLKLTAQAERLRAAGGLLGAPRPPQPGTTVE